MRQAQLVLPAKPGMWHASETCIEEYSPPLLACDWNEPHQNSEWAIRGTPELCGCSSHHVRGCACHVASPDPGMLSLVWCLQTLQDVDEIVTPCVRQVQARDAGVWQTAEPPEAVYVVPENVVDEALTKVRGFRISGFAVASADWVLRPSSSNSTPVLAAGVHVHGSLPGLEPFSRSFCEPLGPGLSRLR